MADKEAEIRLHEAKIAQVTTLSFFKALMKIKKAVIFTESKVMR